MWWIRFVSGNAFWTTVIEGQTGEYHCDQRRAKSQLTTMDITGVAIEERPVCIVFRMPNARARMSTVV